MSRVPTVCTKNRDFRYYIPRRLTPIWKMHIKRWNFTALFIVWQAYFLYSPSIINESAFSNQFPLRRIVTIPDVLNTLQNNLCHCPYHKIPTFPVVSFRILHLYSQSGFFIGRCYFSMRHWLKVIRQRSRIKNPNMFVSQRQTAAWGIKGTDRSTACFIKAQNVQFHHMQRLARARTPTEEWDPLRV
jgi:hypothetical protein